MLLATRKQSFIRLVNFVPGPFAYFSVMKSMWQNETKRVYNNRSRVSRIEEHKTDVYPHFYVIIESIPSTFNVAP